LHGTDAATANIFRLVPHHKKFLVKQRNDTEIVLRYWEGNQTEIETAVQQAEDDLLGYANCHSYVGVWIFLSKLTERTAELINQGRDTGSELKWARIFQAVPFKLLRDLAHALDDGPSVLGEAHCGGSRNKAFAVSHEQFGLDLVRKIMKLEADGAWR